MNSAYSIQLLSYYVVFSTVLTFKLKYYDFKNCE